MAEPKISFANADWETAREREEKKEEEFSRTVDENNRLAST